MGRGGCARTCVWRTLMRPMDSIVVCMSAFFWLRDRLSGRRRLAVMFRVSHTVREGKKASVCTEALEDQLWGHRCDLPLLGRHRLSLDVLGLSDD